MRDLKFLIGNQAVYDSLQKKDTKTFYKTEKNLYLGNEQLNNVEMKGATSTKDGAKGLVPRPKKTDAHKFLRGDGTWGELSFQETLYWKKLNGDNDNSGNNSKELKLFGLIIEDESNPADAITYIEDNQNFVSAFMDYDNDIFNFGDWTVQNGAWFMDSKPCVLNYNGTVEYYLDPDNWAKKIDGSDSNIYDENIPGNVMIEIPKIYWKVINDIAAKTTTIYFANQKVDDDFVCWSHIDNNGNELDYCYVSAYEGSLIDGKIRSLSGKTPCASLTVKQESDYIAANNEGSTAIWTKGVLTDRVLIDLLLLLIGKSTETQGIFGKGNVNGGQDTIKVTGTMDDKGLFYGSQDGSSGVKVFGIEHYWGNLWKRIAGWINDNDIQKVKMTHGISDGSDTEGYNLDGSGYIEIINSNSEEVNEGYISKCLYSTIGVIPIEANGSSSTYYGDTLTFGAGGTNYAIVGGCVDSDNAAGAFCTDINHTPYTAYWYVTTMISCKSLLNNK
ncbi:MAG: lectin [Caudoviricetes sp.]|nr:MAG: lectin [Caudoviricetes sp.]